MKIIGPRCGHHSDIMFRLGELCEADEVEYLGGDKSETYHITKGANVYRFSIGSNRVDGGFLEKIQEIPNDA